MSVYRTIHKMSLARKVAKNQPKNTRAAFARRKEGGRGGGGERYELWGTPVLLFCPPQNNGAPHRQNWAWLIRCSNANCSRAPFIFLGATLLCISAASQFLAWVWRHFGAEALTRHSRSWEERMLVYEGRRVWKERSCFWGKINKSKSEEIKNKKNRGKVFFFFFEKVD